MKSEITRRPRFSLLTPTRDRGDWLPRCVESALAQTFEDWEQIVYDNGASHIGDLLPSDPRVRYVRGPADGPADAFQKALDLARGQIIHPLSDDDRLTRRALAIVDREIGGHEWLTGVTSFENRDGHVLFHLGGPLDMNRLRQEYYLGGAVYWKRTLTQIVGGFDSDYDGAADYDLYMRFARRSVPKFVPQVLYRYTDHDGTDSRVRQANQEQMAARIRAQT